MEKTYQELEAEIKNLKLDNRDLRFMLYRALKLTKGKYHPGELTQQEIDFVDQAIIEMDETTEDDIVFMVPADSTVPPSPDYTIIYR